MKKLLLAVLAASALCIMPAAKASPVVPYGTFGYVGFSPDGPSYTGATLGSATSVTFQSVELINTTPATYLGQPNIFASFLTSAVTISPLTLAVSNINGSAVSYSDPNYLTWSGAGDTFSFDLTSGLWSSSGTDNLSFIGLGTFSDGNSTYVSGAAEVSFSFTFTGTTNVSSTFEVPPTYVPPVVPEPSSLVLLGSGLLGAAFLMFRRNRTVRSGSIA